MGFRFRRSMKLAPGVRLNLSTTGVSATLGRRGASVSVGRSGTYANLGVPGTGLSYRERLSGMRGQRTAKRRTVRRWGFLAGLALLAWVLASMVR